MVYDILQDKQGFMWFGTFDGLVRYDGYRLKHYPYDPETKHPMKHKGLKCLFESANGNIWMVSGQMVLSYNPVQDSFYHIKNLGGKPRVGNLSPKYNDIFLQDSAGNIWLRSVRGLFKIREKQGGRSFEIQHYKHRKKDTLSLNGNIVHSMLYDSQHRLWLGTQNGLNLYNGEKDKITRIKGGFKAPVTSLCETASGKICMGTKGKGLYVYNPVAGTFTNYLPKTENKTAVAGKWVRQLVRDGTDKLWLFAGSAETSMMTLQCFDPENGIFTSYFAPFPPTGLFKNSVAHLYVDQAGFLWVATGIDLQRYDPSQEQFTTILQRETYLRDWSLLHNFYQDKAGTLWIGTVSRGVLKYAPSTDKFRYYPLTEFDKEKVEWNLLKPIYEDKQGFLWMRGASGTGRFVFNENDEPQQIAHFPFYGVHFFEDSYSRLWIATMKDMKGFDMRTRQLFSPSTLPNLTGVNFITHEDKDGWLWSVSRGNGVRQYNPLTGEIVHFKKLRANPVILEDKSGNIWFNGRGGLKKYNKQTGKFTFPLTGMETVHATWGNDSILWVTTSGHGLFRFNINTGKSKRYSPKNGFPTSRPITIFMDGHGYLWMSSDVGVICFDPKTETSRLYDESDGLPSVVFSYGSCCRRNGEFFFPLWEGGFIRFHPDSLQNDSIVPRPAIVDFRLFNKTVAIGGEGSPLEQPIWATKELVLQHDQNSFTLGFTAFHYAAPNYNLFRYKTEGIDADWNDPGSQRAVNYAGLSPGAYTFQLKAANHDGIWSEPVTLIITILPPWWATNWAYLFYFALVIIVAFTFYSYKKRQWQLQLKLEQEHLEAERLKDLDAVKTKLYTNITHEFRTPLTIILGMVDQLTAKWGRSDGLEMIKRNGRSLLRLVNQMLDLSKLEAGALPVQQVQGDVIAFLKYVLESFHSLAVRKNIDLLFQSEVADFNMDYDPEKLREILSNLVSNAIKFTPEGGSVQVTTQVSRAGEKEILTIVVEDTGSGIEPKHIHQVFDRFFSQDRHSGAGIGLALTKELVKLLKGTIAVKSDQGQGTTFTIHLPVHRDAPLENATVVPKQVDQQLFKEETDSQHSGQSDKPQLLIIEDNQDVVVYIKSCLQNDYQLEVATNGKEGLEKALEQIPDLIISDVMMPEMDGFEVCQKLKSDFRTSHIPIVLLTAKADPSSKIEGLRTGADAYLAKPFHQEELLVRLQKLLELRKRLRDRYSTYPFTKEQSVTTEFQQEDTFMQKVRSAMESHLDEEQFGVPELCSELGISRSQLYRKFNALTNQPIAHFLRSLRLHKARGLPAKHQTPHLRNCLSGRIQGSRTFFPLL